MDANIICIETSTEITSVALVYDEIKIIEESINEQFKHSEVITTLIDKCLRKAGISINQINAVAISQGPGSYTGLRVASSAAKGICFAKNIPLIAIDSLLCIAFSVRNQQFTSKDAIVATMDAKRDEIYYAIYDNEMNCVHPTSSMKIEKNSFQKWAKRYQLHFCGNAIVKISKLLGTENFRYHTTKISALNLITIANEKFKSEIFENLMSFTPTYLKPPNITIQRKNILLK